MVATIFKGLATAESRRERKLTARRVLAINVEDAIANPSYCPWLEIPITFSRANQWANIPYIGRFPSFSMQPSRKLFRKVLVDSSTAEAPWTSYSPEP